MSYYKADDTALKRGWEVVLKRLDLGQDATEDDVAAAMAGRTTPELEEIAKAGTEADARWRKAAENDALMARIANGGRKDAEGNRGTLQLSGRDVAAKAMTREGQRLGIKSLAAEGEQVVDLTALGRDPEALTRPATSLLDVIPAQIVPARFTYLRQSARTTAAKFVKPGEQKPTSQYELERVEGALGVLAHPSEPIDEYWLADQQSLAVFIQDEMAYGLRTALEQQLVTGDGVAPNLRGFTNVSGIQVVAHAVDAVQTARTALTQVEALGLEGGTYVLNPADWSAIETARTTSGEFLLNQAGAPIERALRRLWGVPVALSTTLPAGTGYLIGRDCLTLYTDGRVNLQWGASGDDFSRNQRRARLEGRFALGATRPNGIVKMTLTAG